MSIEPIRRGPGLAPGAPTGARAATLPQTRRPGAPAADPRRRGLGQMCVVVTELGEGDGQTLVRNLRRRGSGRVILLARRAGRRDLVGLLTGGLRGAVATEPNAVVGQPGAAPGAVPSPFARTRPDLTSRELSVLRLVADGFSNRAIGDELGLSALTVKSHLARISRKLGTGDRAALVAISIRTGLLA
ncbi:DNA-binding NarL/FixJ family response regulator [Cellulomonas hominis]|uniref:DNA-binding NarL/FixJ family response regulator n=1 Tax=Cellulomonas hominis TaxID=156981 RepID=A0A7W8SH36_9CELL|nr:LuxR C-terminal-related transcriptional regulator [Cellulomonas hominis]MBB5474898.1 DNA-binding NarL/FixJ family response regulator [Cellulomonas hominis]